MLFLQLNQLMKVDWVAQAPVGQEWELLPNKTITKCLAMKEPAERFASRVSEPDSASESKISKPPQQIIDYAENIGKLGAREAMLIFEDDTTSEPVGASKLATSIEESEKAVLAIAYNGQLSKRMFEIASESGVATIIGTSIKSGEKPEDNVEAWATSDWD